MTAALLPTPAQPLVPRGHLPGRRTKQQTSQRPAFTVARQVLEVLADAIAMAQIMIALQQELEQPRLRTACRHGVHRHRLQALERTFHGASVVIHWADLVISPAIDRRGP